MHRHYRFRKEQVTHFPSHANTTFQKFIHAQSIHSITTCKKFARQLTLHFSDNFFEEIYALLPIDTHLTHTQTLIIYKNRLSLIDHSPLECVHMLLKQIHFLNYLTYCKTITHFFPRNIYKIPVATKDYVLFPMEAPDNAQSTIWINPAQITTISSTELDTLLTLSNKFCVQSPIQRRSLQSSMARSFIIWGIIRQEFLFPEKQMDSTHLADYLNVTMTPITSKIFKKLAQTDYAVKKWAFTKCYQEISQKEAFHHC